MAHHFASFATSMISCSIWASTRQLTVTLMPLIYDRRPDIQRLLIWAILAHAVTTELVQMIIPRRTCNPIDLAANLLGIALGIRLVSHWAQISAVPVHLKAGERSKVKQTPRRL